jgi:hypothetical protein
MLWILVVDGLALLYGLLCKLLCVWYGVFLDFVDMVDSADTVVVQGDTV